MPFHQLKIAVKIDSDSAPIQSGKVEDAFKNALDLAQAEKRTVTSLEESQIKEQGEQQQTTPELEEEEEEEEGETESVGGDPTDLESDSDTAAEHIDSSFEEQLNEFIVAGVMDQDDTEKISYPSGVPEEGLTVEEQEQVTELKKKLCVKKKMELELAVMAKRAKRQIPK